MSWLYSQALAEEYSAENCSGGEPYAQLNLSSTPRPFLRNGKTTDFLILSQMDKFQEWLQRHSSC